MMSQHAAAHNHAYDQKHDWPRRCPLEDDEAPPTRGRTTETPQALRCNKLLRMACVSLGARGILDMRSLLKPALTPKAADARAGASSAGSALSRQLPQCLQVPVARAATSHAPRFVGGALPTSPTASPPGAMPTSPGASPFDGPSAQLHPTIAEGSRPLPGPHPLAKTGARVPCQRGTAA